MDQSDQSNPAGSVPGLSPKAAAASWMRPLSVLNSQAGGRPEAGFSMFQYYLRTEKAWREKLGASFTSQWNSAMRHANTTPAAAIAATRRAVGLPRHVRLRNGAEAQIRTVRSDDAKRFGGFVAGLSAVSRGERFGRGLGACSPAMLVDLVNVDGVRHVAFVATLSADHDEEVIGEARYDVGADGESAALTLVVADIWQGQGLADPLLDHLLGAARDAGLRRLVGEVPSSDHRTIRFMQRMGFVACAQGEDRVVLRMELKRGVASRMPQASAPRPVDVLRRWLDNQLFQFGF
ncbi:GNAT family N-acetyltransferase [Variovorax sp. RT4R15]|uniref:GNAT family N-acetyltransferase n=1 Tax=Variovorax sp. RT4R15 TaxID=3443737 RepID=UPI003F4737B7